MRERSLWDGDGAVLVDTSAWVAATRISAGRALLSAAVERGDVAWCWPVRYELSLDARDARQLAAVDQAFEGLREIAVDRSVQRGVLATMRELARDGSHGAHRLPLRDLTVAVAAQRAGLSVLHFDRHFERLGEVLAIDTPWIAPPAG